MMRRWRSDRPQAKAASLTARILSGAEGPRVGRGQGADRTRRAARRSATYTIGARRARGQGAHSICRSKSAIRWRASRSPASDRPAPSICSMPARNGIASASSPANRAKPRSRCCLAALLCAARAFALRRRHRARARAMSRSPFTTWSSRRSRPSCWPISASSSPARRRSSTPGSKSGGVLIRFAGPRLEQGGDELLPVALAPRRPLARRLAVLEHAAAARAVRGTEPVPRPRRARRRQGEPPSPRRSHRGDARRKSGRRLPTARRSSPPRSRGRRLDRAVPRDGEFRLVEPAAVGTVRGDAAARGDARSRPRGTQTPAETPRSKHRLPPVPTSRPARCRRCKPSTASGS